MEVIGVFLIFIVLTLLIVVGIPSAIIKEKKLNAEKKARQESEEKAYREQQELETRENNYSQIIVNKENTLFYSEYSFTAIDFETANGSRNSICQVGLFRYENGEVVYADSFLVQPPGNMYSKINTQIHGIRPSMTQHAPFFPSVWEKIKSFIDGQLVVAHNTDFDLDCLKSTLDLYSLPFPIFESYCTYKKTGLSLDNLTKSLGVELLNHHDALSDAKACAECYIKLRRGLNPNMSKVTPREKKAPLVFHEKLSGNILKPDLNNADPNSPFFNKKVVITGVFESFTRDSLATILRNTGADINACISKKTNMVIVGSEAGPMKLERIKRLNEEGAKILTLDEIEFLNILKKYKNSIQNIDKINSV